MKELKLEVGKQAKLNNQYSYVVKFIHKEDGYYIEENKQKFGPYYKVFFEKSAKHNNDMFITCYNLDKSTIYRVGLYGIEVADIIDTSVEASKILNKMIKREIKIEGCALLGVENGYSVFVDESDNKFFIVNNDDEIKPVEEYQKFDTYMQLVKSYRAKGIRVYDDEIERLSKKAIFINFNDLEEIVKGLKFEDFSQSLTDSVKNGRKFNMGMMDNSVSKILIDILKESGKTISIRKIYLNDQNYEKGLNEKGIYRISAGEKVSTLSYFTQRNKEKWEMICDAFEQKYYEILSAVEVDEDTLNFIKNFLDCNISSYLAFRIRSLNEEHFSMEIFEWLLDRVYDQNRDYLIDFKIGGVSAKWLKALNADIYNKLWSEYEEDFYIVRRFMNGEFDNNLEEYNQLLNGRD